MHHRTIRDLTGGDILGTLNLTDVALPARRYRADKSTLGEISVVAP